MASQSRGIVSLPASGGEAGLNRYLAEIKKFPILSPEEEFMLAKRWREHEDTEAAAKLVNSHLRLVAKIAMGYRGYGLPVSELISEGNIGLMQGVKKFEPDRGFPRLPRSARPATVLCRPGSPATGSRRPRHP
jgi:RNA polymerase sigma-32 factor